MISIMISHAVHSYALPQVYCPQERTLRKESIMTTLLVLRMLTLGLDIAAVGWEFVSTVKLDSPEWERRATWYAHQASREKEL